MFFFFKRKTAYEIWYGLVGSEMWIGDRALLFLAEEGRATHGRPELSWRVGKAGLTISCRGRAGHTWQRAALAGRKRLALLFLVEEGRATHGMPELSWRVGRGWPYYSL